jgi:hypothetical protein
VLPAAVLLATLMGSPTLGQGACASTREFP